MYPEVPGRGCHNQFCNFTHLLRLCIRKFRKWSLNISVKLNRVVHLPQGQMPPLNVMWLPLQRCADCTGHLFPFCSAPKCLCYIIQLSFFQESPGTEPYPNAFIVCFETKLLRYNIWQKFMLYRSWLTHEHTQWCPDLYHMPQNGGQQNMFPFLYSLKLYFFFNRGNGICVI